MEISISLSIGVDTKISGTLDATPTPLSLETDGNLLLETDGAIILEDG